MKLYQFRLHVNFTGTVIVNLWSNKKHTITDSMVLDRDAFHDWQEVNSCKYQIDTLNISSKVVEMFVTRR